MIAQNVLFVSVSGRKLQGIVKTGFPSSLYSLPDEIIIAIICISRSRQCLLRIFMGGKVRSYVERNVSIEYLTESLSGPVVTEIKTFECETSNYIANRQKKTVFYVST